MLEKFQSSAVFLSKDAVLSCYACGKTSGLVVDLGASGTLVTPVQDGWVDLRGMSRSPVGGKMLDAYAVHLLQNNHNLSLRPLYRVKKNPVDPAGVADSYLLGLGLGIGKGLGPRYLRAEERIFSAGTVHESFHTYQLLEAGRELKESVARVAETALSEDPRYASLPTVPFELPDGTPLDVGVERFQLPELIMNPTPLATMASFPIPIPSSGGGKILGLPELITSAVGRCELDQQATLYNNLLFVGGGASFEGLTERLRAELDRLLAGTGGVGRVKILPPGQGVEKATAAWLGGSIVASLGGFHEMWISRREYEEYGPNIVDRKCP